VILSVFRDPESPQKLFPGSCQEPHLSPAVEETVLSGDSGRVLDASSGDSISNPYCLV
jgi:hypothetical protein